MRKGFKRITAYLLAVFLCIPVFFVSGNTVAEAATFREMNNDEVFLKQNTSITCTLSAAAMMLRRTAMCAGYADWRDITEESIKEEGWVEGVGLRWKFTVYGMSTDHSYLFGNTKKQQLIELLDKYPQGFVIYNSGSWGQNHAVFLCDYDAEKDIFYAADPSNKIASGRIPLAETSMAGTSQQSMINNLDACWFVTTPAVVKNGDEYKSETIVESDKYNPDKDTAKYEATKQNIGEYFVITSTIPTVMREYPSGNAAVAKEVSSGDILFVESSGNNNYGAVWYKTADGCYIFSSNLTAFDEYSENIEKFNLTATPNAGTYTVASVSDSSVAVRIDATEGNNIVANIANGKKLYIVESGYNSAGALWLKTADGYYVKASELQFESADESADCITVSETIKLSGKYLAEPEKDVHYSGDAQLYKVTASALNVRTSAVSGEIIGTLKNGELVEVLEIADGWCKINFNDTQAWVSHKYLVLVADGENGNSAVVTTDKSKIQLGGQITCNVENAEDCKFRYSVYDSSGNIVFSEDGYTTKGVFSFKPVNTGLYYFGVELYYSETKVVYIYSANFTVYKKLRINSVKNDAEGNAEINNPVKWTVSADSSDDDAIYVYKLYLGDTLVKSTESSVSAFSYTPEKTGVYTLEVQLKDKYSVSDTVKNEVKVKNTVTVDSLVMDAESPATGQKVKFTASISGLTDNDSVAFYVYKNGNVVTYSAYSKNNYAEFTFDTAGEYSVYCVIKSGEETIVRKSIKFSVADSIMLGDVNSDGVITAADARLALRVAARLESITGAAFTAADVNRDGLITAVDARKILRCAARLENLI